MGLLDKAMNLRAAYTHQKRGYRLEERKEFSIVRGVLSKLGLPTANFDKNLSTLLINEDYNDPYSTGNNAMIAGTYNARTNILNLPENEEDTIHELFHMASNDLDNKETLDGCKIKTLGSTFGTSFNEGIADYFTSLAVSNYTFRYPYEALIVKYIAKVYGYDIFREHFNGNAQAFYDAFKNDKPFILSLGVLLDKFHEISQKCILSGNPLSFKENADEASEAFISAMGGFLTLLQLKNIDETEFLDELRALMNTQNSEYITAINSFFELRSRNHGIDNVLKDITLEEGVGLK